MSKFNFVNESDRKMLQTAFDAVTQLELWDFVTNFNEENGFMFSKSPNVDRIYSKIEQLGYNGHSGSSFAWTLRTMQYIGKHGMDNFILAYTSR